MNVIDGRQIRQRHHETCDVAVVGSGPAGAAAAKELARAGARVVVVEEGPWVQPRDYPEDSFGAMALLYRDMGAAILRGNSPMPFVQGRAVGGTSVINGAISWRLPQDVHAEWVLRDPALKDALPWSELEQLFDRIEEDLNIHPTPDVIAGANNRLLAKGAEALGLEHRAIRRNVRDCKGLGRCLQGCPQGNKMAMDRTYLPQASANGARILSSTTVHRVRMSHDRAVGLEATSAGGARVSVDARHAVVVAASAVQTPALLMRSGLHQEPTGRHFQCHPGVSMAGYFDEPVRLWTGATQGHEVIGLRRQGIKFEALGYDLAMAATRLKSVGRALSEELATLPHWAHFGAAIRATGEGFVRAGRRRAAVRFSLSPEDVLRARRSVALMGEMMLAAGARFVTPGVPGWHEKVTDRSVMARFAVEGPLDPRAYTMATTHLFGTCRMGSDPSRSVVRPDFRHHRIDALYVADSSVFPTNTGVNPQTSILALAHLCARRVAERSR